MAHDKHGRHAHGSFNNATESRQLLSGISERADRRAKEQHDDIQSLYPVLDRTQNEKEHYAQRLQQAEAKIQQHEAKITQLETQLDECRTDIMSTIPIDAVSDARISSELKSVREGLSNWVEVLGEINALETRFCSDAPNLVSLMNIRGLPNLFPGGTGIAQEELITKLLFGWILRELFQVLIPGAPSHHNQLLGYLLNEMRRLEPRKG